MKVQRRPRTVNRALAATAPGSAAPATDSATPAAEPAEVTAPTAAPAPATGGESKTASSSGGSARLGATVAGGDGIHEDRVATWIRTQADAELARVHSTGSKCVPIKVKNMAVSVEQDVVTNRVELDTAFDFTKVKQILVSEAVPCPYKKHFAYVNVVLLTEKPMPLLFPYLYDTRYTGNDLKRWALVNNSLSTARHVVDAFEAV